ncbi:LON peptidase substrate-binding domain-containing protein [Microbulbifer harenosus]|uniref:ATP-dependent protease La domain-containing protein n=1 Tax=Microbulbifer harenosus TaxID=2576840 RepID=A0ABY2USI6_9GAMM|nr:MULTISPECIES: LON peptidase substrate-binding domain-containing protein [Microbulbifer]QIL89767.1 ATP-dependent protease La domain-containing protein [Microbulbifer sp. SH-1]TLM79609.1 ATP-dependent protease La domain-containing protein [Microbulbifer harenosus]
MSLIPLFPLHMALFPGVTLPLRIFEQRYLRLVSESLKTDTGFGVALIRSGREVGPAEVWPIGLYVRIVDWSQGEEGLLHIEVTGQSRFRVLETYSEDDGLLMADVEWLPDEESHPVPDSCDGLLAVLNELKQHAAILALKFAPVESAEALSWQLAQLLPLDDAVRLELLASHDPLERLAHIAANLDRWARQ